VSEQVSVKQAILATVVSVESYLERSKTFRFASDVVRQGDPVAVPGDKVPVVVAADNRAWARKN
jgi:hypothetical protein